MSHNTTTIIGCRRSTTSVKQCELNECVRANKHFGTKSINVCLIFGYLKL